MGLHDMCWSWGARVWECEQSQSTISYQDYLGRIQYLAAVSPRPAGPVGKSEDYGPCGWQAGIQFINQTTRPEDWIIMYVEYWQIIRSEALCGNFDANKTRGQDIVALWFPCAQIFFIPCSTVDLYFSLEWHMMPLGILHSPCPTDEILARCVL